MARVRFRSFERGLWPAGPKETAPVGSLRRAKGVHPVDRRSIRSREGSALVTALDAHSLARFNDVRFQGAGTQFYRAGVSIKTGLDGSRLAFVRMPPTVGVVDYLFVAGGGDLFKVDNAGTVTQWGITAPLDGFTQADNGAGVLVGVYRYAVTFRNSVSGTRSNANPTEVVTANLSSRQIRLSNLPISADPQVNRREIWRTVGNGTVKFLAGTVNDNVTTTFDDNVADSALASEQLPTDNLPPDDTFDDACGPHASRMWWTRDSVAGKRGRLYYSPSGRAEAVVGFLDVTNDDDPTQTCVEWAGSLWLWSEGHVYQIIGTSEPFLYREAFGAPGTIRPHSVVRTPHGTFYQAEDGLRLFNGATSRLFAFEALGTLFQGEAQENIAAFEALVAAYGRSELFIADEVTTLAVNPERGTWREPGVPAKALLFEDDTKQIIASFGGKVVEFEKEGQLTDDGVAIAFEVETPSALVDASQRGLLQRIYVEANTQGESLTPSAIVDGVAVALAPLITNGRAIVEYPLPRDAQTVGVRLAGSVSKQVEVFGMEFDAYIPQQEPTREAATPTVRP